MSGAGKPAVYTIPPGEAFLPALVRAILEGRLFGGPAPDDLYLSQWRILLPTRRAVRTLRETFLEHAPEKARLLPVIQALGDVDEDEIVITGTGDDLDLPPAASDARRQFALAGMVRDWAAACPSSHAARAVSGSMAQAMRMATSVMQLIDSIDNGDIDLASVPAKLMEHPEMPLHNEEAMDFLRIIAQLYPAWLESEGLMGPAQRRSALLRLEAERLAAHPPAAPVIAAGSTGSLPATAELLDTIARLPSGCVVLPGLDTVLDDESWAAIGDQHPQFGMRELLARFGVSREEVRLMPGVEPTRTGQARARLASEIMRPSATTHLWQNVGNHADELKFACAGITWLEAPEMREQALMIALAMRRALDEDRQCALITPDRQLAKRVSAELARWNVHVDDSAGEPLSQHAAGIFFELAAAAMAPDAAPETVTALLAHELAGASLGAGDDPRELARQLEIAVFRPLLSGHDIAGLAARTAQARQMADQRHAHPSVKRLVTTGQWPAIEAYALRIARVCQPLLSLARSGEAQPLDTLLATHIQLAEALSHDGEDAPCRLWQGEAGQSLSMLLRTVLDHAAAAPAMVFEDYCIWLADQLAQVPVRRRYQLHPKLAILGLLEARLVQPEVVILGGLNEGVWPAAADPGPWLSRPQHTTLQLQLPERRLGLAAHDFAQNLGAREVMLAWTRKSGGTPLVRSRWLLRLDAVLQAAGLEAEAAPDTQLSSICNQLDAHARVPGMEPKAPAPKPPVKDRPRRLSVTRVTRLLHDPYWAYAFYVLNLQPLPPLGQQPGPAERGQFTHAVVERFAREYPDAMPDNALELLKAMAAEMAEKDIADDAQRLVWLQQLRRALEWFVPIDDDLRQSARRIHVEANGRLEVNINDETFTLTGKADRIDELNTGTGRIIDFKTGQASFSKATAKGYSPQLELEGWMLADGAFAGIGPLVASELMYIRLSGGTPAGEVIRPKENDPVEARIEQAHDGFIRLMQHYVQPDATYPARAGDEAWGRRSDYDHLSRWREWGLGRQPDSAGGDE